MVVADAGGTDASSPCIELPAEGSDCTAGQVSCDRVDLCCARAAACDSTTKKWKLSGMECLQCQMHPCGDKNCGGAEMCLARASGVSGGSTSYECAPYPAECAREWTCACVEMHLPGGCALSPNGCSATELPVKLQCMGI